MLLASPVFCSRKSRFPWLQSCALNRATSSEELPLVFIMQAKEAKAGKISKTRQAAAEAVDVESCDAVDDDDDDDEIILVKGPRLELL